MMNNEEIPKALEILKTMRQLPEFIHRMDKEHVEEALEIAMVAVEKMIPKELKADEDDNDGKIFRCSYCGSIVYGYFKGYKHCPECGQAIKRF